MTTEPDNVLHPLQQMNRQNAILEHTNELLKQELSQATEELAKYRSALHGYEGAHTRIEHLEQQLAQAQKQNERLMARDAEWAESQAKAVTKYAEARALLEDMFAPFCWYDDGDERTEYYECAWCNAKTKAPLDMQHKPSCPWPKISAFLAKEQSDGN